MNGNYQLSLWMGSVASVVALGRWHLGVQNIDLHVWPSISMQFYLLGPLLLGLEFRFLSDSPEKNQTNKHVKITGNTRK